MKYALFLGCTIPARARNYELSARKVAHKLGVELVDLEQFICCGFPIKSSDLKSSIILGAYNLALAQNESLDVCTLCTSCTSAMTEVAHLLSEDEDMRGEVNKGLSKAGLRYDATNQGTATPPRSRLHVASTKPFAFSPGSGRRVRPSLRPLRRPPCSPRTSCASRAGTRRPHVRPPWARAGGPWRRSPQKRSCAGSDVRPRRDCRNLGDTDWASP